MLGETSLACHKIVDRGSCQLEGLCAAAGLGFSAVAENICGGLSLACVAMDWRGLLRDLEVCKQCVLTLFVLQTGFPVQNSVLACLSASIPGAH